MYILHTCKRIGKTGLINLPKRWRVKLGFDCGELVEISLRDNAIWIYHSNRNNTENHRYISSNGNISIPSEIRKLLKINPETKVCVYVDTEENSFVLRPE
ncbi:hypothetical protein [Virgibacillus tibetensis]